MEMNKDLNCYSLFQLYGKINHGFHFLFSILGEFKSRTLPRFHIDYSHCGEGGDYLFLIFSTHIVRCSKHLSLIQLTKIYDEIMSAFLIVRLRNPVLIRQAATTTT